MEGLDVKDGAEELAYVPWRLNDGPLEAVGDGPSCAGEKADGDGAKGLLVLIRYGKYISGKDQSSLTQTQSAVAREVVEG